MRYYEVQYPEDIPPALVTNIRKLRDLPPGTTITAIVTERDGSLADSWDVPVVDGKPQVDGRGKDAPRYQEL